ncbi:hypothetical protein T484DRAFT_1766021 [Baffinella frigidus]|nr:hypothetical protein T484DRAFT_1766021 [Cryptophyta sp. CCMP2293]
MPVPPSRRGAWAVGGLAGCAGLLLVVLVAHSGREPGPTELAKAGWGEFLFSRFSGEPAERSEARADQQERAGSAHPRRARAPAANGPDAVPEVVQSKKQLLRKLKQVLASKEKGGVHIENAGHASKQEKAEKPEESQRARRHPSVRREYRHVPGKAFAANPAWRELATSQGKKYYWNPQRHTTQWAAPHAAWSNPASQDITRAATGALASAGGQRTQQLFETEQLAGCPQPMEGGLVTGCDAINKMGRDWRTLQSVGAQCILVRKSDHF